VFKRLTVFDNILGAQSCGRDLPIWQMLVSTGGNERPRREKVERILEEVGLADRRDTMAQELPLGEQRRLELARALAREPDLLLLDEPAGGMTPQETERMVELIRTVADNGPTVFLIEHKMGMVMKLCRHIVVLNFGRKIAEGTPKQVQSNDAVREAYLGSRAVNA
jgi:branched-chain amino acid transport system ATP-binding protein